MEEKNTDISVSDAARESSGGESPREDTGAGFSLKDFLLSLLGGEILAHDFFRRQFKLIILLVFFAIVYVGNRYASQQQLVRIDRLKKQLTDAKYNALTRSSELTEKSRQSKIEDYVSKGKTSLQTSTTPPYLIK